MSYYEKAPQHRRSSKRVHYKQLHVQMYQILFAVDNLTIANTFLWCYYCGFVLTIPLMATFDPENMRITDHVLRIIDTFLGNYRDNFE